MKKNVKKIYETSVVAVDENGAATAAAPTKKKRLKTLRAAVMCLLVFTLLCGIIYPISLTLIAQATFPYEANGSQIVVTFPDGHEEIYGSELIGQDYESAKHLFGRVNTGAPTNLSPESEEYLELLNERITARKEKLAAIGYEEKSIPDELISSSGSGVDPHISPDVAYFQVPAIVAARNEGIEAEEDKITSAEVNAIIKKYTEGRFLGIFGEKRVNVLLVNLALDGRI